MSAQTELFLIPTTKKRKGFNIYCLFHSLHSFHSFHMQRNNHTSFPHSPSTQHAHKNTTFLREKHQNIQKAQSPSSATQDTLYNGEQLGFAKRRCVKCSKILLDQQNETDICSQCVKMLKTIQSGNFAKFIKFVLYFKKNKLPSYSNQNRLKRIQSIESCQSLILDKADSSLKHPLFKPKALSKESSELRSANNAENSQSIVSKHSVKSYKKQQIGQLTSTQKIASSGGYFCNECQVFPIQGRRFHCLHCSDYDLCQKCYFYVGHRHEVKVFKESKQEQLKRVKQNALIQSQYLKSTLPKLSHSIQQFQSIPKLFTSYNIKSKG